MTVLESGLFLVLLQAPSLTLGRHFNHSLSHFVICDIEHSYLICKHLWVGSTWRFLLGNHFNSINQLCLKVTCALLAPRIF